MNLNSRLLICWLGLLAGNCIYQALHAKNWGRAADISFFQACAIIAARVSIEAAQ